ncbi:hypothetical protein Areg01_25250 [Actinoplanes regularis]|nr:hypothetical protein Areg01_25250 [Actinoplanes regularis]
MTPKATRTVRQAAKVPTDPEKASARAAKVPTDPEKASATAAKVRTDPEKVSAMAGRVPTKSEKARHRTARTIQMRARPTPATGRPECRPRAGSRKTEPIPAAINQP